MSLILDALSKAEREKRKSPADVAELLVTEPVPSTARRDRSPAIWGLVIAVVLLLVAIVFLLLRDSTNPTVDPVQSTPIASPPSSAPAPTLAATRDETALRRTAAPAVAQNVQSAKSAKSAPSPDPVPTTARRDADQARIAALYATSEMSETAGAPVTESGLEAASGPSAALKEADATGLPEVSASTELSETPVDIEAVIREVRQTASEGSLEPHPAALLSDLSQQFRDRVPSLMYLRHDYSSLGRSTVLINGEALAEGQRTRGVQVKEILEDSVVLTYEGTDFRIRALNSWVNL